MIQTQEETKVHYTPEHWCWNLEACKPCCCNDKSWFVAPSERSHTFYLPTREYKDATGRAVILLSFRKAQEKSSSIMVELIYDVEIFILK